PSLFPRSAPNRHPPSFPTRRSSDLRHAKVGREPADEHALDAALLEVALEPGAGLAVGLEKSRVAVHVPVVALPEDELRVGNRKVDRKSTRLNSSHEWISYAVFCLKK